MASSPSDHTTICGSRAFKDVLSDIEAVLEERIDAAIAAAPALAFSSNVDRKETSVDLTEMADIIRSVPPQPVIFVHPLLGDDVFKLDETGFMLGPKALVRLQSHCADNAAPTARDILNGVRPFLGVEILDVIDVINNPSHPMHRRLQDSLADRYNGCPGAI